MGADGLLLAIESSTAWLGVALLSGESLVAKRCEHQRVPGSERLLPLIDLLLNSEKVGLHEIEGYAVASGPGSFTGLRVGVATVKGLAFGSGPCIASVSTLDALAHAAWAGSGGEKEQIVVSALDARRDELYASASCSRPDAPSLCLIEPAVLSADRIVERLPETSDPVVWVGDHPTAGREASRAAGRPGEIRQPPEGAPDPEWVGRLGARVLAAGAGLRPDELTPWYLRRAEAEVRRTGEAFEPHRNGV